MVTGKIATYQLAGNACMVVAACLFISASLDKTVKQTTQTYIQQVSQLKMLPQEDSTSALIELASNQRMANIVTKAIKDGASLSELISSGFLGSVARELRSDYIDDNVYSALSTNGANTELQIIDGSTRKLRERWYVSIQPGSYFDTKPRASLLLPDESIPIPNCEESEQPAIAYLVATQDLSELQENRVPEVTISTEFSPYPAYRFELGTTDQPLTYRIMVDVGCTVKTAE